MILDFFLKSPILILLPFFLFYVIYLRIWKRITFNRIIKQISNWKIVFCLVFVILLLTIDWIYLKSNGQGASEIFETFYNHGWIEIASGIVIYLLLEFKIKEYGEVPTEDGKRDYDWILDGIAKSKRTVKIIDNDFASFFEGENEQKNRLKLKRSLISCLRSLERRQKIEVLLLHPNTLAAQQRHDDLQFNTMDGARSKYFDLFERINEGLQFLHDFINSDLKDLKDDFGVPLSSKIDIKLFNTSYSLVFISWDQFINFSLLRPKVFTDKETFKTLRSTPLANYFIENFNEIWNDEKTIGLKDYKLVKILDENGGLIINSILWGADSYNHDLPIFIGVEEDSINAFNTAIQNNSQSKIIQIVHDNKMRWAKIYKLPAIGKTQDIENSYDELNIVANINEFAKNQIQKKSKKWFSSNQLYKIEYTHLHRIMLQDDDYVKKHLNERGYCFTPHTKYEVYLGLHLKKMLHSLFFFYTDLFKRYYHNFLVQEKYLRILTHYNCTIGINMQISVTNDSEKNNIADGKFPRIEFSDDKIDFDGFEKDVLKQLNIFLKRTIEADIIRVFGLKYGLTKKEKNKEQDVIGNYSITVNLIQSVVTKNSTISHRLKTDYVENEADYTILHFVGKKNITGGMPSIYYGDKKDSIRDYNFNSTLDSIYVKTSGSVHGKIVVDSSMTTYNEHEAKQRIRKEKRNLELELNRKLTNDENSRLKKVNATGYRNLIAIEITKK